MWSKPAKSEHKKGSVINFVNLIKGCTQTEPNAVSLTKRRRSYAPVCLRNEQSYTFADFLSVEARALRPMNVTSERANRIVLGRKFSYNNIQPTVINFCPNILTTSIHKITRSAAKQQTQAYSTKHNDVHIPSRTFMCVCVCVHVGNI